MTVGVDRMAAPPTWRAASGDHGIGVIAKRGCLAAAEEQPHVTAVDVVDEIPQALGRIAAVVLGFGWVALDVGLDQLFQLYQQSIVLAVVTQSDRSEHERSLGGHRQLQC